MAGKFPPLRNLRKTTVLAIVVFLGFFVHRFVMFFIDDEVNFTDNSDIELSPANSVVCRHIVNGEPFGSDSVFEENTRLYVFRLLQILHVTRKTPLSISGSWELIRYLLKLATSQAMCVARCSLRTWSNLANGVSIWWRVASCLPVGSFAW